MKLNEVVRNAKQNKLEDIEEFNKETPYDWFYDYLLAHMGSPAIRSKYANWKKKNPDKFPKLFIETFRRTTNKQNLVTFSGLFADLDDVERMVTFNGDRVDFTGYIDFEGLGSKEKLESVKPPFKFGYVDVFSVVNNELDEYLDWFPTSAREMDLSKNNFTTLSGIHKKLKMCKLFSATDNPLTGGLLAILMIEGIKHVDLEFTKYDKDDVILIQQYLKKGHIGKRAVMDAQSEMLDAGSDEEAATI